MQHLDVTKACAYIEKVLEEYPDTKVYIGCDSYKRKLKKGIWEAVYTTALVVHLNGRHGCTVFGRVDRERDYDQNKSRPSLRLMNEVYRVSELYLNVADLIPDLEIEVHLDINPDVKHGSSCVIQQAVGYIRGVCGVTPLVKPDAWAASHVADRFRVAA